MKPSAAKRVFALQEILILIADFLSKDAESLRSACLVSREWNEQFIQILWRSPPIQALVAIADISRRQTLARFIRHLEFHGDEEGSLHNQVTDLSFDLLRTITIDSYRSADVPFTINQYLHVPLEELLFYGGDVEDFLGLLRERCPRLQTLLLDNIDTDLNWGSELVPLLRARRNLSDVCFSYQDRLIPDELFVTVASHPGIKRLTLLNEVGESAIQTVVNTQTETNSDTPPFPVLESLSIKIRLEPFALLLPFIASSLSQLTLSLMGVHDARILQQLSQRLSQLEKLELTFGFDLELRREEFLMLKAFTQLRTLVLSNFQSQSMAGHELTDEDFEDVVKQLPRLEILTFHVNNSFTSPVLISLGKYCRLLKECDIWGTYSIRPLESFDGPLFPRLSELSVGSLEYFQPPPPGASTSRTRNEIKSAAAQTVEILYRHAPVLEDLCLIHGDDFSEAVQELSDERS